MVTSVTKIIDGHEVIITTLPFRRAAPLAVKVGKLIGPAVASFVKDATKIQDASNPENAAEVGASVVQALTQFFKDADPDFSCQVMTELLRGTFVDKKEVTDVYMDVFFAGKLKLAYDIASAVVEANFPDFLELIGISKTEMPTVIVK